MKKKLLSAMLIAAMTASLFAGCGSSSDDSSSSSSSSSSGSSSSDSDSADIDYGSGEIVIWVADAAVSLTQTAAEQFIEDNGLDYTVTVESVGEGDAASQMITDVDGGADIYGFAQDQLSRLISAGALQIISDDYVTWIEENNSDGSVEAGQVGDTTYAFPMSGDNGYFLYYDSSVVTDPTSLEQIVADCEAAGKNFYYAFTSWYEESFFFATGCTLEYETDDDGSFTSATFDIASEAGQVALDEMVELASSTAFQSGSDASSAVDYAAIVDGTWDSDTIKAALGDNYACAKLPSFTGSDGETYQLGSFSGYKLLGIKPQTDAGKLMVCYMLAQYLTDYDMQMERFNELGWGPSNLEAQASDEVQSDVTVSAFNAQLDYAIPQGQYPDEYWTILNTLGADCIAKGAGTEDNIGSDSLSYLEDIQAQLTALAG